LDGFAAGGNKAFDGSRQDTGLLGVVQYEPLFEWFLAPERAGPPDIDLDIESGRREAVIQFVRNHYGHDRAAQVANVISYRSRSAVHGIA